MGIAVRKWGTSNGLAFSVDPDLSLFEMITLCWPGLADTHAASVHAESAARTAATGDVRPMPIIEEMKDSLVQEFQSAYANPPLA